MNNNGIKVQTDTAEAIDIADKRQVERLREQYPPGTKIQCIHMDDPYHAVAPGSIGTVDHVDDVGTIHMSWENGSSLGLIPGEDRFKIIEKSKMCKPCNGSPQ